MRTRSADVEVLMDLLEQVRATPGRDRKLDVRILALVQQPGEWSAADIEHACGNPERTCSPPEYTDTIDAVRALVEHVLPGTDYEVGRISGQPFGKVRFDSLTSVKEECDTEALSLLAALLAAKLTLTQEAADVQG